MICKRNERRVKEMMRVKEIACKGNEEANHNYYTKYNRSDRSKIVLNCNYNLIGYTFFRSIRSDLELNRASVFHVIM
jgi:hypothetical protein